MKRETLKKALFQKFQAEDYEEAFWNIIEKYDCADLPCTICPIRIVLKGKGVCSKFALTQIKKQEEKDA